MKHLRVAGIVAGNTFGVAALVYAGFLIYVPLGFALTGAVALLVAYVLDVGGGD